MATSPVDPVTGLPISHGPVLLFCKYLSSMSTVLSLRYRLLRRSTVKETYNYLVLTGFAILDLADQITKGEFFWKNIEGAVTLGLSSAFVPAAKVTYATSAIGGAAIPLACHLYYMVRIYRISRNWKWRGVVLAILIFCLLVSLMAVRAVLSFSSDSHTEQSVFALITGRVGLRRPIDYGEDIKVVPWLVGDAFVDIVLSLILVIYLRSQRSDFEDTNALINKWIFISLESGLLSAVCALTDMLLAVIFPEEPYHFAVNFILSKVYINSVLILFHTITRNRVKRGDSSSAGNSNPRYNGSMKHSGVGVTTDVETTQETVPVSFKGRPHYRARDQLDDEELSYPEKQANMES
ncbi:hypothetical protein BT69DRAFT_1300950 [Atractiella rhizophila]|nr:hypothetical protein BT69DRAFT_1300950 [Atractiella rhizophila]